jgi:hypothetical protein
MAELMRRALVANAFRLDEGGEEFFQHRLPLDRSSMTHWRNRMLLQESLAVATKTGAMKPIRPLSHHCRYHGASTT